jgi:hypothetical protein
MAGVSEERLTDKLTHAEYRILRCKSLDRFAVKAQRFQRERP